MHAHDLMHAVEDGSASLSGKSVLLVVAVAIVLLWAGSSGGRGR